VSYAPPEDPNKMLDQLLKETATCCICGRETPDDNDPGDWMFYERGRCWTTCRSCRHPRRAPVSHGGFAVWFVILLAIIAACVASLIHYLA